MSPLPWFVMLLAVLFAASAPAVMPRPQPEAGQAAQLMELRHEKWMAQYDRSYKDEVEKAARFQIFRDNVEFIESFNQRASDGSKKYRLGVNQFADLTHDEFHNMTKHRMGEIGFADLPPTFMYENVTDPPDSVDWRSSGAVTDVKDQGVCGSCWAFASVATVESLVQIRTGILVTLSEQQLLDCIDGDGCLGGYANKAFEYIINNGGLTVDVECPYQGVDSNSCNVYKTLYNIAGYQFVPANNESALLAAVAALPVYADITVGSPEFRFYSGGIFNSECSSPSPLYHAVQVIGYGTEADGTKYWIVKNSWGTNWGEGGFGRIERESVNAGPEGVCSIAQRALYPVM